MSYCVPDASHETIVEIKKSKFIARAGFADSRDAAMVLLENARRAYPDARHHCWAYLIGSPASPATAAMSDDGEPSGTAGKPILNVLNHKNVGDIMVIVSRYFGGIKLGAGGLVRAYSGAAQQVMEELTVKEQVSFVRRTVTTDFRHEQYFRHWLEQRNATVTECHYSHQVIMHIALPEILAVQLIRECERLGALLS